MRSIGGINMKTLGSFIRAARTQAGVESRTLAVLLGVSPSYISDIELDRRVPAEPVLRGLAEHLGLDYSAVLAYAGKLDIETRQYLLDHPTAMKLLLRVARAELDDPALTQLVAQVVRIQGESTYDILANGNAIECRLCGRTSFNANDVAERYCSACNFFHEERGK